MSRTLYKIKQGEPLTLNLPLKVGGVATAVAGWTPYLTVKADAGQPDSDALATLTLGSGIVVYDAYTWTATLPSSATKTALPSAYLIEIEAEDPAGDPHPLEECDLIIEPELHRAA